MHLTSYLNLMVREYSHIFWANHKSSASPEVRMIPHTSIRLIAFAMDHKQTVVTCSNSSSWVIWGKAFGASYSGLSKVKLKQQTITETQTKILWEFKAWSKQQAPHPKNITWKQQTKEWFWHDWLWICYPTQHSLPDHTSRSLQLSSPFEASISWRSKLEECWTTHPKSFAY